jgi:hypothetical protein
LRPSPVAGLMPTPTGIEQMLGRQSCRSERDPRPGLGNRPPVRVGLWPFKTMDAARLRGDEFPVPLRGIGADDGLVVLSRVAETSSSADLEHRCRAVAAGSDSGRGARGCGSVSVRGQNTPELISRHGLLLVRPGALPP